MTTSKGIRKMSETSMQIAFQFLGQRCRETIKIGIEEDGYKKAELLKDRIVKKIGDGTFDYISTFPNSRLAYILTGETPPHDFRMHLANCAACGKLFEPKGKQVQRSKKQNVYCSRNCSVRGTAGIGVQPLPEWAIILLSECKKRAARKGIEFSLNEDDFRTMLFRSGWRCELSGIEFQFEKSVRKGPHRPFSPSVDRIESRKGYTPDNVRLVCLAVNIAMNTWGDSVLISIANGISQQQKSSKIRRHLDTTPLQPA